MKNSYTTVFLLMLNLYNCFGQEIAGNENKSTVPLENSFNDILGLTFHTTKTNDKGTLSFQLGHRFGELDGYNQFFGLDEYASWRLEFNYAISNDLMIGIARNSIEKLHDTYFKYRILRQTENNNIPFTISVLPRIGINGELQDEIEKEILETKHRINYSLNLLIGRKISENTSIQIFPIFVHQNLTRRIQDNNQSFALGGLVKHKFSRTGSILVEYAHNFNYQEMDESYNGNFAFGVNFSTLSHNFSLLLTNSIYMLENQAIPVNNGSVFDNSLRIGFNISRNFIL